MNVDKAQSDVDAQQKIVNQLRVDKEQVSQKISLGSKGFFEAYGYTNALKVLEENSVEIGKYTEVGAENDATSLENFKKAIAMVKTGNTLRTTDDNFRYKILIFWLKTLGILSPPFCYLSVSDATTAKYNTMNDNTTATISAPRKSKLNSIAPPSMRMR